MTEKKLVDLMISKNTKQAEAVTKAFPNSADKDELAEAQNLMSKHDKECGHIGRMVMKSKLDISIPTITEQQLFELLELECKQQAQDQDDYDLEISC